MNATHFAICVSIVCCLTTSPTLAQSGGGAQSLVTEMQGMMTAASVGIVAQTPPAGSTPGSSQVVIRSPGVVSSPPAAWSEARFGDVSLSHPDYSDAALLLGFNQLVSLPQYQATSLEFGGISTGGDVCPLIDSYGRLQLSQTWYFISVSVKRKPGPSPVYGQDGSVLRSLAGDAPERALLSYYAENSIGIDESLIDKTVAEQTSVQLGYPAASTVDVAGVDWGMGSISVTPDSQRSHLFAPVRDCFYFTLTKDWILDNSAFVALSSVPLESSVIYCMTWQPSLSWSVPFVALGEDELFGVGNELPIEIDAISVYLPGGIAGSTRRVVLSTTLASGNTDQLLGYDAQHMPNGALPLRTSGNNLVSERMGLITVGSILERDDVDATCGTDPHAGVADGVIGTPMTRLVDAELKPFGLSMYRSITGPSTSPLDLVNLQANGLDLGPGAAGEVRFYVGFPTQHQVSNLKGIPDTWFWLGAAPVPPGATTASFDYPGNLPFSSHVSVGAFLYRYPSSDPVRSSWVTVLRY